jgi:putative spermidine/putrescine transport system permease protein
LSLLDRGVPHRDAGDVASRRTGDVAPRRTLLRRALRTSGPALAVSPFLVYVILGLGFPTIGVVYYAFRGETGGWTLGNVNLVSHGIFLVGFENSIKLSLITAIVPGILGVVVGYAILTSPNALLRRLTTTAAGVLANFGGVNLTFIFIATLGSTGVLTAWLNAIKLYPWHFGFSLYTFSGVALVYFYFQIPLMVLVITPAFSGLKQSWREAAESLGASSYRYWRHVGIPVLTPSVLGGMLLLFGSAFSAYATAQSLTNGDIALAPIQIGNFVDGNVLANQVHVGYAIALGMLIILTIVMVSYGLLRRRASKWLE